MNWINVTKDTKLPRDENIIVEDENGWIGNAYFDDYGWRLETFGRTSKEIYFDKIIRYFILDN